MGGRGRGRGSSRTGMRLDDGGVIRRGPILIAPKLFPYNTRLCKRHGQLQRADQSLVAFNRILMNAWRFEQYICRVAARRSARSFATLPVDHQLTLSEQKEAIADLIGWEYFPDELKQERYRPPLQLGLAPPKRRVARVKAAADSEEDEDDIDTEETVDVGEDFGGEDYAHDHNADEDRDDDLEGGDEGDHF